MKRAADFGCALLGLIILSPLLLILAVAVKMTSRGPIIFKQKRVGARGRQFDMYKFRTMRVDTPSDVPTHLMTGSETYVTPAGRFLRKTSLDELPQLVNIVKGDMSIVGPRPALWNQHDLIEAREKHGANEVRPGLTGWAQINGRDELSIAEKAALDGYYAQHRGLPMDLRCILGSFGVVARGVGVVEGAVTLPPEKSSAAARNDVGTTKKVGQTQ